MPNSRYNTYGLINSYFIYCYKLKHILIEKQKVFAYNNYPREIVEAVVKLEINIGGV